MNFLHLKGLRVGRESPPADGIYQVVALQDADIATLIRTSTADGKYHLRRYVLTGLAFHVLRQLAEVGPKAFVLTNDDSHVGEINVAEWGIVKAGFDSSGRYSSRPEMTNYLGQLGSGNVPLLAEEYLGDHPPPLKYRFAYAEAPTQVSEVRRTIESSDEESGFLSGLCRSCKLVTWGHEGSAFYFATSIKDVALAISNSLSAPSYSGAKTQTFRDFTQIGT